MGIARRPRPRKIPRRPADYGISARHAVAGESCDRNGPRRRQGGHLIRPRSADLPRYAARSRQDRRGPRMRPGNRVQTIAWPFARIRWRIFSFLFGFGFIAYVQQKTITVAADRMMPELNLSQLQIGLLEQAFVLGYAI